MPTQTTFTGGYGSPIVMGRTPWTRTVVRPNALGSGWPPLDDSERLLRYAEYEALVENRAQDVFARLQLSSGQKEKIAIAVAIPELLCNVWADSVWSDPPTIELPGTKAADAWDAIDEANDFTEIGAWESVFAAAMRGTSVLRLFRSEELGELTGSPVQIEEVDAGIYFPKLRKGSSRLLDYVVLAWEENRGDADGKEELWQVREVHAVEPESGRYTITTSERRAKSTTFAVVNVEITDLDFLPFVDMHAARWSGRHWGMSEIARCMGQLDDIDNTLSNIAEILEYHGKPVLQVPASAMVNGVFEKGSDRALGVRNSADADIARYIVFDGQLEGQFQQLDKELELVFLTAEVPSTYFGLGVSGEIGSGTAMRLQLQNYLKKAGRWQSRETLRLKKLVDMALRVEGGAYEDEARVAKITHGSPLPADEEQDARIETALKTAGLTSLELAIRKLRRVPADEVDEEIARIEDEKEASVQAAQNAFGGAIPGKPGSGATQPGNGPQDAPPSRRGGASAQRQG